MSRMFRLTLPFTILLSACATAPAEPTATPIPSPTPLPTFEEFYSGTYDVLRTIEDSFNAFAALNDQFAEDIKVINDQGWRESIVAELLTMNENGIKLVREDVPAEFEDFQNRLNQLAFEINQMASKYAQGIDNEDGEIFRESLDHAVSARDLLLGGLAELEETQ